MDGGNGGKTWWVYMISCRGGKIYTGTAIDPEARYEAHRAGKGAAFTRANPPVALLRCVALRKPLGGVPGGGGAEKNAPGGRRSPGPGEGEDGARFRASIKEMCISCGVCVDTVPAVFRFDADNRAEAYDPKGADEAAIQEAIDLAR